MKKKLIIFFFIIIALAIYLLPRYTKYHLPITIKKPIESVKKENKRIKNAAHELLKFNKQNSYSQDYAFIVDMKEHSGRNRFFVFDFKKDTIVKQGLVAHGSCNKNYLTSAKFDNIEGCGCSSLGKYKIGGSYAGQFGKAFKLYGLDKTNSKAFERFVVLHAYDCVPNNETYPQPICNSLGCPMVSYSFLKTLDGYIAKSEKRIILWMIN